MNKRNRKHHFIIFCTLFIMCTALCSFGCAADIPDEIKVSNTETTEVQQETIKIPEKDLTKIEAVVAPEETSPIDTFSYKMVLLNRNINEEASRITDCYAIEFESCEYSAATFNVFDEKGAEIPLVYDDVTIETYTGRICEYSSDNFSEHLKNNSLLDSRDVFVIMMSYRKDEPLNNISIKTTILNRNKGLSENATMMVNANVDELTTNQQYVHGSALVKLDSKYYLFSQNGFGGCNHPVAQFSMCKLIPVSPDDTTIEEQLNGKFEFVDINGEKIKCPDGFEVYFKTSANGYDIGLVAKDDSSIFTEEIAEFAKTIYLKYTDKEKNSIVFYSK